MRVVTIEVPKWIADLYPKSGSIAGIPYSTSKYIPKDMILCIAVKKGEPPFLRPE